MLNGIGAKIKDPSTYLTTIKYSGSFGDENSGKVVPFSFGISGIACLPTGDIDPTKSPKIFVGMDLSKLSPTPVWKNTIFTLEGTYDPATGKHRWILGTGFQQ